MGRKRRITTPDFPRVKSLVNQQRTDKQISNQFYCCPRVVRNFRVAHNLPKHTDIDAPTLEKKILQLQQNEKQTHGIRTVASELRAQNVRVQHKRVQTTMKKIVPNLVDARNPAKGAYGIKKIPLPTAGPMEAWHFDQHEKMWLFGMMTYAFRGRCSGYMPSLTLLRNKTPDSVMICLLSGVQHLRGVVSLKGYFDCGTEAKKIQDFYHEHIGPESVIKTTSKQNCPIELAWRLWHDKGEWIYRVELYGLVSLLLLDVNNPLHLGIVWSAYSSDCQWEMDYFLSYVINNNKIRKQPRWQKKARLPAEVMESFYKQLSGRGYMNVFEPNKQCDEYDQYVIDCDQYLQTNFSSNNDDIIRPSEIYLDDFELKNNFDPISIPDGICKSDWSDATERKIMKGRYHSIAADYLTAKGQHLRDIIVNTILFEMLLMGVFEAVGGKSLFRMYRFILHRLFTENLLISIGVPIEEHLTPHIQRTFDNIGDLLMQAIENVLNELEICVEDIIHEQVFDECVSK
eukprot:103322_1